MESHTYHSVSPAIRLDWLQRYSRSHTALRLLNAIEALATGDGGWSEPLPRSALARAAGIENRRALARGLEEIAGEIAIDGVSARRARYGLRCLIDAAHGTPVLECNRRIQYADGDTPDAIVSAGHVTGSPLHECDAGTQYGADSGQDAIVSAGHNNADPVGERDARIQYAESGEQPAIVSAGYVMAVGNPDCIRRTQYADGDTPGANVSAGYITADDGGRNVSAGHNPEDGQGANVSAGHVTAAAPCESTDSVDQSFEGMNDHTLQESGSFIPSTQSIESHRLWAATGGEQVDYEPDGTELGHWQRRRTRELLRLAGFDPDRLDLEANSLDWYRRAAIFRLLRRAAGEQGLSEDRAAELATGRPVLLLERDYDYWCFQVAKGVKFKNRRTNRTETPALEWLVAQMQDGRYGVGHGYEPNWRWPELSLCPECGAEHRNGHGYLCNACTGEPDEEPIETQPDFSIPPPPAPPQPAIPQAVLDSWTAVLGALELTAGRITAARYRQATPLAFENGTLTLQVSSPPMLVWLQERRYRLLSNLAKYWLVDEPLRALRLVGADMEERVA